MDDAQPAEDELAAASAEIVDAAEMAPAAAAAALGDAVAGAIAKLAEGARHEARSADERAELLVGHPRDEEGLEAGLQGEVVGLPAEGVEGRAPRAEALGEDRAETVGTPRSEGMVESPTHAAREAKDLRGVGREPVPDDLGEGRADHPGQGRAPA